MAHGLSCSLSCGIFLDQGLNPCLLHWQADSLLSQHGNPIPILLYQNIPKQQQQLLKLNNEKTNKPVLKWANRYLTKEDIRMANKCMKRSSAAFVMSELQIKTMMKYHYMLTSMTIIWNTDNTKCWQGCGAIGTPQIAGRNAKWYNHLGGHV